MGMKVEVDSFMNGLMVYDGTRSGLYAFYTHYPWLKYQTQGEVHVPNEYMISWTYVNLW